MTKVYRCKTCNNPLKHMSGTQWVCIQSEKNCKDSLGVTLIHEEE